VNQLFDFEEVQAETYFRLALFHIAVNMRRMFPIFRSFEYDDLADFGRKVQIVETLGPSFPSDTASII
jgi:hypothetical protein